MRFDGGDPTASQLAMLDGSAESWARTTADLLAEAAFMSRRVGQPLARTPGVAGILSRLTPSTLWLYDDDVDVDQLLREIDGWQPRPEIMVPDHAVELIAAMETRGWVATATVDRLRCDLDRRLPPSPPAALCIRAATKADLPAIRDLHDRAFGSDHAIDYLPDEMLSVAGLHLVIAAWSARPDELIGMSGVRMRHQGALVFCVGTSPHDRRRGVSTALVSACLDWAAERGAPFAIADVDLPMPAPALWQHLGFLSTGRWRRCAPGAA